MAANCVNKYIFSRNPTILIENLGRRTEEVRAVGAWVHPDSIVYSDAAVCAKLEEERIRQCQMEKEKKLKKFQDEVRKRVQKLEAAKRQQQLENSYKAIENERKIIKQSTAAAEKNTSRRNRCTLRTNENSLSITRPSSAYVESKSEPIEVEKEFENQRYRVHKHTRTAKNKLMSRKIVTEDYVKDNVRDLSNPQVMHPRAAEESCSSPQVKMDDLQEKVNKETHDEVEIDSVDAITERLEEELRKVTSLQNKAAREIHPQRTVKKSRKYDITSTSVPNIYPGVENEEERQQTQQQRVLYRKLFMDIEREQVRETQRKKVHGRKIAQLKKDKEEERKRIELASAKLNEPSKSLPDTVLREEEVTDEAIDMVAHINRQEQKRRQKDLENSRYVEALKQTLREKMSQRSVDLPCLCSCGDSLWDSSPETCANNCVFYRNPKAYTKALQSVLASSEAM